MQPQFYNIVNDELRSSKETHRVTDPRTEEELWECPVATAEDFEDAVTAAQQAFTKWSQTTVPERQALLIQLADILRANASELASILMKETGKSKILADIDVQASVAQCLYYSQTALQDEVQHEDTHSRVVATHIPLGTVAAICPWNFPLILSNIKVVSALVTGNCVIVKPSPSTPYAVMRWVELSRGVLPPGVFQVLNGGAELGAAMTAHPGIAKISFTGTIAVGKKVMAACAKTLKKVTLELAGNDACIVCDDADLDVAVPAVASGGFFNAGQVCVASKRIYVHESIYDEFLDRLVEVVEKQFAIQEDGLAPSVFGPVDNRVQYEVVKGIIEDCRNKGYKIVTGGKTEEVKGKGFWLPPTIVSRPPEESLLVQEEQFGPVLPILSWSDEDDVIKRSNLANAGLGASVYSSDLARAERIARRLEAGGVWINQFERPNFGAYFSGIKDSGFGGEMGKQGLLSYAYTKCLHFPK
ncbi:aldehyde dehydrogenase [Chaetomium globosum CBS 148.51]|uniref:aldehyde dehydrogenase (NAD(+)) n=1 Tax=Chaetomium globosum (strain ATCC 6205 / CBS 148.51 / DSM 1962 / NBRC 6347 / NRRL 1970) TaxID=306901 RepID=Q2GVC7_CHAGB|nr:aldehyde dehydrogenase [Chaetomium globosum CBS 148.51]EAQ86824.1 aldehyde dehydrogenase [Chaetomium globosum CBS 148.51]